MLALCPCELGEAKRGVGVRDDVGRRVVHEPVARECRLDVPVELVAVARQQVRAGDALGRVLGMQVEREPFDDGAKPALEPLGPALADAAEGSDVVRPDEDLVLRHRASVLAIGRFSGRTVASVDERTPHRRV